MRGFWRGRMIGPTPPSGLLACARLGRVPFRQSMVSLCRHSRPPARQGPSWIWEGWNRAVTHLGARESAAVCRHLAANNAPLAERVT